MGGGFEAAVSLAASASFGNDVGFVRLGEIFYNFVGFFINNEGTRWDFDDQIIALAAGFLFSLAMSPVFSFKLAFESKGI